MPKVLQSTEWVGHIHIKRRFLNALVFDDVRTSQLLLIDSQKGKATGTPLGMFLYEPPVVAHCCQEQCALRDCIYNSSAWGFSVARFRLSG